PSNPNIILNLRPHKLNNSLQKLEPRNNLLVHPVHDRRENVLLNELPRRINCYTDTPPDHLNDGPEQLKHGCKIILHKRNNSVEDDLNALPPQCDNQLNAVEHWSCNVLPQPPEHSPDSIKHGLNDRQHIRLEPRNHDLNRNHDSVPGNLDYVPQPFSARSNTIPNGLHDRPHILHEPIRHG